MCYLAGAVPTLPDLSRLVPHRAPMLLIDELVSVDGDSAVSRVTIRPDSPFAVNGRVPGWVSLEYAAQCVAAFAGTRDHAAGSKPRPGFLVAARDFTLSTDNFDVGDCLLVHARLTWGEAVVGRFECHIEREGEVVARASLSVYQPEQRDEGRAEVHGGGRDDNRSDDAVSG